MPKTPQDVVVEILIEKINKEKRLPWQRPWNRLSVPRNIATKTEYRGMNLMTTLMSPFDSPYFITQKELKKRGGHFKKGSKLVVFPIIFWKFFDQEVDVNGRVSQRPPICRFYKVFNVEQCDGIEVPEIEGESQDNDPIEAAEELIGKYKGAPKYKETGDRAFYRPSEDLIQVPKLNQFHSSVEYYCTRFHEMGHSTGHTDRLGRDGITDEIMFGSHKYSYEELIAEFCAAMCCAEVGIEKPIIDNSAAYLKSWVAKLKDKPKQLVTAAGAAQKAFDHIVGKKFDSDPPPNE